MILPYVYKLTNRETNEFYFGYRFQNVKLGLRSSDDIGKKYFTSSKYVKNIFHKFEIEIIAEFFKINDAYDFEQALIKEHITNSLCLNKHYQNFSDKKFKHDIPHSEETKNKMRKPHGKINRVARGNPAWNKGLTKETDARVRIMAEKRAAAGNPQNKGKPHSLERIEKVRIKLVNREVPDDQRIKMSAAKKNKTWEEIYGIEGAQLKRKQNLPKGKNHHNAKAIMTPDGKFDTITDAVKYYKIADQTVRNRCISEKPKWNNWFYIGHSI